MRGEGDASGAAFCSVWIGDGFVFNIFWAGCVTSPCFAFCTFAKRGATALARCSAARLTGCVRTARAGQQGNSLRADRTPEPATDAAGSLHRSAPLSFQEGYDIP